MSDKGDRSNEMSEAVCPKIDNAHVSVDFICGRLHVTAEVET